MKLRTSGLLVFVLLILVLAVAAAACGQTLTTAGTLTTLINFNGTNGASPYMSLVQATDGNLYGTTSAGGANEVDCINGCGTAFKMTPAGTLTTIYSFCADAFCLDGFFPAAGLFQATDGNLYGTTMWGESNALGGIFRITLEGTETVLGSLGGTEIGYAPTAGVVQGTDGNLYGTTSSGGLWGGAVFEISPTPGGGFSSLFSFAHAGGVDGGNPEAGLIQATDGNFYGTTSTAGAHGGGGIFKITARGKLTPVYDFCSQLNCADGSAPVSGVVQAADGNFYGVTSADGTHGHGTVFKITPGGTLTTLYSFCSQANCTDGSTPVGAGLVLGSDGNFYGTTGYGGTNVGSCGGSGCGTVFEITTKGKLTTLHSFDGIDGGYADGLVQSTNGAFYGTTASGGNNNDCYEGSTCGTIFRLSLGLSPFVETQTSYGKVRTEVVILGTDLADATGVSFNGTKSSTFTVISSSELTAKVPVGATTGTVTVTMPGGALKSNAPFHVTPSINSFTPASGPVGTQVQIDGQSLAQTVGLAFDGVAATEFTVNSNKEVIATIPTGAATGKITITTLGGIAKSPTSFTVTN